MTWLSLARRSQWLRGHGLNGEVLWDRPIPWEGWALFRLGGIALVTAADGRALSCDGSGSFLAQGGPTGDSNDVFGIDPAGEPIRISRRGVHLICAALDGQVRWRAVVDQTLGPLAVGMPGTVVFLGKSLAWFQNEPRLASISAILAAVSQNSGVVQSRTGLGNTFRTRPGDHPNPEARARVAASNSPMGKRPSLALRESARYATLYRTTPEFALPMNHSTANGLPPLPQAPTQR